MPVERSRSPIRTSGEGLTSPDELRRRGCALPGALNALRKLADWPDTIQSVLTGNTREAAEVKLRAFDLDQYIDFDIGAYGTDDDTRANLVKIARQRATAARGTPSTPRQLC